MSKQLELVYSTLRNSLLAASQSNSFDVDKENVANLPKSKKESMSATPCTAIMRLIPASPKSPYSQKTAEDDELLFIQPFSEHEFVDLDAISGCWDTVMKFEPYEDGREANWFSYQDSDDGDICQEGWYVVGHAAKGQLFLDSPTLSAHQLEAAAEYEDGVAFLESPAEGDSDVVFWESPVASEDGRSLQGEVPEIALDWFAETEAAAGGGGGGNSSGNLNASANTDTNGSSARHNAARAVSRLAFLARLDALRSEAGGGAARGAFVAVAPEAGGGGGGGGSGFTVLRHRQLKDLVFDQAAPLPPPPPPEDPPPPRFAFIRRASEAAAAKDAPTVFKDLLSKTAIRGSSLGQRRSFNADQPQVSPSLKSGSQPLLNLPTAPASVGGSNADGSKFRVLRATKGASLETFPNPSLTTMDLQPMNPASARATVLPDHYGLSISPSQSPSQILETSLRAHNVSLPNTLMPPDPSFSAPAQSSNDSKRPLPVASSSSEYILVTSPPPRRAPPPPQRSVPGFSADSTSSALAPGERIFIASPSPRPAPPPPIDQPAFGPPPGSPQHSFSTVSPVNSIKPFGIRSVQLAEKTSFKLLRTHKKKDEDNVELSPVSATLDPSVSILNSSGFSLPSSPVHSRQTHHQEITNVLPVLPPQSAAPPLPAIPPPIETISLAHNNINEKGHQIDSAGVSPPLSNTVDLNAINDSKVKPLTRKPPPPPPIRVQQQQQATQPDFFIKKFILAKMCIEGSEKYAVSEEEAQLWKEEGLRYLHELKASNMPETQYYLGMCYAKDGNYNQAFPAYKAAAVATFTEAYYAVAVCFEHGLGTSVSLNEAKFYYEEGAKENHLLSMHRMAVALLNGDLGWKVDIVEGLDWLHKCADYPQQDSTKSLALYQLSFIYEHGFPNRLVIPSVILANKYILEAVNNQHVGAMTRLAAAYESGSPALGISRDMIKATELYIEAAALGDPEAMFILAEYYLTGVTIMDCGCSLDAQHATSSSASNSLMISPSAEELIDTWALPGLESHSIPTPPNSPPATLFHLEEPMQTTTQKPHDGPCAFRCLIPQSIEDAYALLEKLANPPPAAAAATSETDNGKLLPIGPNTVTIPGNSMAATAQRNAQLQSDAKFGLGFLCEYGLDPTKPGVVDVERAEQYYRESKNILANQKLSELQKKRDDAVPPPPPLPLPPAGGGLGAAHPAAAAGGDGVPAAGGGGGGDAGRFWVVKARREKKPDDAAVAFQNRLAVAGMVNSTSSSSPKNRGDEEKCAIM
ncbi:hypothetical protein BDR26DRAFT_1005607 [Obelidium mucronatum]|nr:hypothetical protein BDR26DRAFT_1005607 [Obelidium mucronatum]